MTIPASPLLPVRPDLVVFDLDGTLIDSAPDIAQAVNTLLAEDGLPAHSLEAVRGMIGNGLETLVERAYVAHGVHLDPQTLTTRQTRMSAIYAGALVDLTRLRAGAHEAVDTVCALGLSCGVVTNKPEGFSRQILDHFDLLSSLNVVIGGDSGMPKKPAPDMLLAACARVAVAPGRTILIGDSRADLGCARAAGIRCILVRGGYTDQPADALGADLVIDELTDLPALLKAAQERAA